MIIGLEHYLILALLLLLIGVYGVITMRHAIGILMSIELIFNAANINLIVFSQAMKSMLGQVFALFVIAIAAAEAAVGLAIIIMAYRNFKTVSVDEIDLLKW